MGSKVTLAEVAARAGVSASTAARVMHDSGYVSDDNRERVAAAIRDLGYRPNMLARGLRNSRSYTIGVVLSSATDNPFYTKVTHSLRTAANAAGYSVLNFNHSYNSRSESEGLKRFLDHNVEAVITCHIFDPGNLEPLTQAGIPIIEIERQMLPSAHHVLIDPLPGMIGAVQALVRHGHRDIGFLGGRTITDFIGSGPLISVEGQRTEAFRAALAACGLDPAAARCDSVRYTSGPDRRLQGAVWGADVLAASDRPTAVIVGSDVLAAGVLQAAYALGLRVPDDLAIIGFDDSLAPFLAPPLASIAQPYQALGEVAISLLAEVKGATGSLTRRLPTHFVERASIGKRQG